LETEIEKIACLIGLCNWVAAEDVILQNPWKSPGRAGVGGISPARLTEVGVDAVELPPGDEHLVTIGGIDRNRRLIRSIAEDVLTI